MYKSRGTQKGGMGCSDFVPFNGITKIQSELSIRGISVILMCSYLRYNTLFFPVQTKPLQMWLLECFQIHKGIYYFYKKTHIRLLSQRHCFYCFIVLLLRSIQTLLQCIVLSVVIKKRKRHHFAHEKHKNSSDFSRNIRQISLSLSQSLCAIIQVLCKHCG